MRSDILPKITRNFVSIKAQVLKEFNVTYDDIKSSTRLANVVKARTLLVNILRVENHSLYEIGAYVNRDHATVIHSLGRHKSLMKTNHSYNRIYNIFHDCHIAKCKVSQQASTTKMIQWYRKQADKLEKSLK